MYVYMPLPQINIIYQMISKWPEFNSLDIICKFNTLFFQHVYIF